MICGSTSGRPTEVIQSFPMSLRFDHLGASKQRISPAKVSPSEFISAFETEWNRIAHLSQSSATGAFTYRKIVKDLFAFKRRKGIFYWRGSPNPTIMLWKTYRQKTISPTTKQRSVS
jgi:hypothetical protein